MATCFGKRCSFRFSMRAFYKRLSVCMCASFPHSFEGWVWDLIILVRDRCLFYYFLGFLATVWKGGCEFCLSSPEP